MTEKILIYDFGSQYTQLIARRLREINVYCEIHPFNSAIRPDSLTKGVILSGSPCSVNDQNPPQIDVFALFEQVPVLGICYGAQYMAKVAGGQVDKSLHREYGRAKMLQTGIENALLNGLNFESQVWMSHGDTIGILPDNFDIIAKTESIPVAGFRWNGFNHPVYGIQFHPEVYHSTEGLELLKNFAIDICGCQADWTPGHFIDETVASLRETIGDEKVILGLSGGVDSSVAAALLHQAIGENLTCIFIDNGLLRKNEFEEVQANYESMNLNLWAINARNEFYTELAGKSDPEEKRKTIGRVFIEIFQREASKIEGASWLAQGTIYPDVIESVSVNGPSVTIKSHHNVGGLPEKMNLKVVEPLRALFKDEVRRVGKA